MNAFDFFVVFAVLLLINIFLRAFFEKEELPDIMWIVLYLGMSISIILWVHLILQPDPPPTEAQKAEIAKKQAEYEAQKIPKIFSKTNDGCVVYSFVDEWRKHYFTRCEKMVVTDSEFTSGKTRKVESIQTN